MKGHMQDGKFHPHTDYKKGTRMSRDQKQKTKGVKVKDKKTCAICRDPFTPRPQSAETRNVCKKCIEVLSPDERKARVVMASELEGMSRAKREEWEHVVGSQVVKVKHEMMNGRPVTSVRFANGEEWFEFDTISHQEEYLKEENIEVDDEITGEFVEIDHPDIAGYVTMPTGKVLFGEREDSRKSRDGSTDELPTMGRANVRLHTSDRGDRGTQFTLEIGDQLSDIGIYNLSEDGIDRTQKIIANSSKLKTINTKNDMSEFSSEIKRIIDEMIKEGDLK